VPRWPWLKTQVSSRQPRPTGWTPLNFVGLLRALPTAGSASAEGSNTAEIVSLALLWCDPHRNDLRDRVEKVRQLLEATHPPLPGGPDVGSAARGLSILLLHAAYEQLLTSLCRSLLESAASLRVGNRRLKPGIRLFSVFTLLEGVTNVTPTTVWKNHGPKVIETLEHGKAAVLPTDLFPKDGSYMKRSQVVLMAGLFGLGDPGTILKEVWARLDTIVTERNSIAHGGVTADEVGRRYSLDDMRVLCNLWELRWSEFLTAAEVAGSNRDFYRT
jgi:hypothetical protein